MPAKRASVAFDPLDTPCPPPKRARLPSPKVVIPPPSKLTNHIPVTVNSLSILSPRVVIPHYVSVEINNFKVNSPQVVIPHPSKPTSRLAQRGQAKKVRVPTPFYPGIPDPRKPADSSSTNSVSEMMPKRLTEGPIYSKTFTDFLRKHGPEAAEQADIMDWEREADHKWRFERSRQQAQQAQIEKKEAADRAAAQRAHAHSSAIQRNERIEAWNAEVIVETGVAAVMKRDTMAAMRGPANGHR